MTTRSTRSRPVLTIGGHDHPDPAVPCTVEFGPTPAMNKTNGRVQFTPNAEQRSPH